MKYICLDCHRTFMYAAEETIQKSEDPIDMLEFHVCPYCFSKNIDEQKLEEPKIVSVKSVDLAEVDAWLEKGYEVRELYAKTATLIKRTEKTEVSA